MPKYSLDDSRSNRSRSKLSAYAFIIIIIIVGIAAFYIGKHNGKTTTVTNNPIQNQMVGNNALRRLSTNSDINVGNLNLTAEITSITGDNRVAVQTLSGDTYNLTITGQTTYFNNNQKIAFSSLRTSDLVSINIIVQRDGSLTPLRIQLVK